MAKRVREIMLPLEEYAVVGEDATVLDALQALRAAQGVLPPDRQPHRAVLVRNRRGGIIGKVHYFAFLRAMLPERANLQAREALKRAGVGADLQESSLRMLDLLAGDLVDLCQRARSVLVRDVYSSATVSIQESATIPDAIAEFLAHQTHSLLVRRREETVGILRLSDLFDEVSRQILDEECREERSV